MKVREVPHNSQMVLNKLYVSGVPTRWFVVSANDKRFEFVHKSQNFFLEMSPTPSEMAKFLRERV